MEKHTEKMKSLASTLINAMIDHDSDEWPPVCALFAYQPQHPASISQDTSTENTST